jgi:hypothetical protein
MKIASSDNDRTTVADLQGRLVLFRPIKTDERDTRHGRRMCVECEAWTVDDDGTPDGVGVVTVWNDVLVRVLGSNIGELLAGRVERPAKAYIFDDLTNAEVQRAETAERIVNPVQPAEATLTAADEVF